MKKEGETEKKRGKEKREIRAFGQSGAPVPAIASSASTTTVNRRAAATPPGAGSTLDFSYQTINTLLDAMCASSSTRARALDPSVLPARPLHSLGAPLVKTRVTARRKRHAPPCASTRARVSPSVAPLSFFTTIVATFSVAMLMLNPPFQNRTPSARPNKL